MKLAGNSWSLRFLRWVRCGMIVLGMTVLFGRAGAREIIGFNRDIQPILSNKCFRCHGPDSHARKADLRLDVEALAKAKRDGHYVIVPGEPEKSELIRRIETQKAEDQMPPPDSGKRLSSEEKARLRQWIQQGARWEGHWAYLPLAKPDLPAVQPGLAGRNPVDIFILDRLEREGLSPAPPADRRTLIRRLSLDLLGLPPGVEEVRRFVASRDPLAYPRLVDRLLSSPHFGEQMATHWLDLVRYADTVGFHGDQDVSVWPYRDYVIDAFNHNMPFDQFTREQIAGDLIPGASRAQRVASAYNRLNRMTAEGGAQDKEYLAKYAADRVRTLGSVWLGSTLGCSQCHDHKFDPFTMKDFYSLEAFFADLKEKGYYAGARWGPKLTLPSPPQAQRMAFLNQRISALEAYLETPTELLVSAQQEWEDGLRQHLRRGSLIWEPLRPSKWKTDHGTSLAVQADASVLARGETPEAEIYELILPADRSPITAIRLEALKYPTLVAGGFSRGKGAFVLSEVEVETAASPVGDFQAVPMAYAEASDSRKGFPISAAIDGKMATGWSVSDSSKARDPRAVFVFSDPIQGGNGTRIRVRLKHGSKYPTQQLGRFRISIISIPRPTVSQYGVPEDVLAGLATPEEDRSRSQTEVLWRFFRKKTPLLDAPRREVAMLKTQRADLRKKIPTTLISVSVQPRVMRVLPRGNWMDDSGAIVTPALPAFLRGPKTTERRLTRLDLAAWLTSETNPLTARVFLNRLWMLFMGTGFSKVLDDVGSQGEWPTQPGLLNWLASEFVETGWDVKHMIRLIVTSQAYCRSSKPSRELRERDPFNRLYARQSRWRLDAETIRDDALDVSGLMVDRVGGPSVKPYQPAGYYAQLNFPKRVYHPDKGANQYRRGLYTHWQRTFLHPMLKAFDAPSREECTAERVRSNTPLQSLVLLNDPSFVEAARVFAAKIDAHAPSTEAGIAWAFERTLSRQPSASESETLKGLYRATLQRYQGSVDDAKALLRVGDAHATSEGREPELAAWTAVARALFNLHETINRY